MWLTLLIMNHSSSCRAKIGTARQVFAAKWVLFIVFEGLTLSPLDGLYGLMTNTGKDNFSGGYVQNIVNVLMAVFYNSLRFHLSF